MPVFERAGDRVIVLLSSGNLAGTQAVIGLLKQRDARNEVPNLWSVQPMFDVAPVISDTVRDADRRDGQHLADSDTGFNASFIFGRIAGEPPRLFRTDAEGNLIEASLETPFLQTSETKCEKAILDRVIARSASLNDAAKCVLVSFDSIMRSNLSVGMPIDLLCYEADSLGVSMRRRFDEGDPYFTALSGQWSEGVRQVFSRLPNLDW